MKRVIAVLIAAILPKVAFAEANNFDLSQVDQQAHLAVSYGITMTSSLLLEKKGFKKNDAILYGSLISLGLGLLKEYAVDKEASQGDLIADAIGTGLGAGVVWYFDF